MGVVRRFYLLTQQIFKFVHTNLLCLFSTAHETVSARVGVGCAVPCPFPGSFFRGWGQDTGASFPPFYLPPAGFRGIRGRYLKSRGHRGASSLRGDTTPTSAKRFGTQAQMAWAGHGFTTSGPSLSRCRHPLLSQYVTALSARRMLSRFSTHCGFVGTAFYVVRRMSRSVGWRYVCVVWGSV